MPTTIGDVIAQKKQDDQVEAQAKAAADAADQAFATAQATADASDAQLKLALSQAGPTYHQNADGSIEVYLPDSSAIGYQFIQPVAASTVVDLNPAPTPTPTPDPSPAPAPEPAPTAAPQQ